MVYKVEGTVVVPSLVANVWISFKLLAPGKLSTGRSLVSAVCVCVVHGATAMLFGGDPAALIHSRDQAIED
jgi:hypothetical protein